MLVLVLVGLAVFPVADSRAVQDGENVPLGTASQVTFERNGAFCAGGTAVAGEWILASRHQFARVTEPGAYRVRGLAGEPDGGRTVVNIVRHPDADLALVQVDPPLPDGSWNSRLATQAPGRFDPVNSYGAGSDGQLRHRLTEVIDPVASANAALLRQAGGVFLSWFPEGVEPMVTNVRDHPGDSGSGLFAEDGTQVGVHTGSAPYLSVNGDGDFWGPMWRQSYETPVWPFVGWIDDVINGQTTSSTPAPGDDSSGESTPGDLVMSLPPQNGTTADWVVGNLRGAGNNRGTEEAVCASPSCSFDDRPVDNGSLARLPMATSDGAYAVRQVIVWCASTAPVPGAVGNRTVRVSFTNLDPFPTDIGVGWWDVLPEEVGRGSTSTAIDRDALPAC